MLTSILTWHLHRWAEIGRLCCLLWSPHLPPSKPPATNTRDWMIEWGEGRGGRERGRRGTIDTERNSERWFFFAAFNESIIRRRQQDKDKETKDRERDNKSFPLYYGGTGKKNEGDSMKKSMKKRSLFCLKIQNKPYTDPQNVIFIAPRQNQAERTLRRMHTQRRIHMCAYIHARKFWAWAQNVRIDTFKVQTHEERKRWCTDVVVQFACEDTFRVLYSAELPVKGLELHIVKFW